MHSDRECREGIGMTLRQWHDTLLRRLERPPLGASIHDRHGLLLELARCALDLRESGTAWCAATFRDSSSFLRQDLRQPRHGRH
ncbi:hypothetical protein Tamer19_45550 [Cupriavidus sp. TA19]|nr:hypothetical protein Tamer19_45550 [Cupriavidus sp. TA19]